MKNIRRCDQSEEVKSRKKVVKSAASSLKHIERSSNPATDDLSSHLRETFEVRRNEIVSQKVKIVDLRRKYPNLFAKKELDEEFFRITGKKNLFQCVPNFLQLYSTQLSNLLASKKILPPWAQDVKSMLEGPNKSIEVIQEVFLLMTLPIHFGESQLVLTYPVSTLTVHYQLFLNVYAVHMYRVILIFFTN